MAEREKVSGFRLPEATLQQLDELVSKGVIKNRTDGVIKSIELLHDFTQYNIRTGTISDAIIWITRSAQIASDWPLFPVHTTFPYYSRKSRVIIKKLGHEHGEFIMDLNGHRLVINVKQDDDGLNNDTTRDEIFEAINNGLSPKEMGKNNIHTDNKEMEMS